MLNPLFKYVAHNGLYKNSYVEIYQDKIELKNSDHKIINRLNFGQVIDWALTEPTINYFKPYRFVFITDQQIPFPLFGPKEHITYHSPIPEDEELIDEIYQFFTERLGSENNDLKEFYSTSYHHEHIWVPKDSKFYKWFGYRSENTLLGSFLSGLIILIFALMGLYYIISTLSF